MKHIKKYVLLFILGAVGYAAMETIWRGHTHWSMMIAGGLCFILFSLAAEALRGRSILLKAVTCAVGVTAIEFIFGVVFNIYLGMGVWDYSHVPFNIMGQICPMFSLLWAGIAIAFLPLADAINKSYA
jgi:uncharacterized membrane protein